MGYETRIDLYEVKVRANELKAVARAISAVAGGAGHPHWMVGLLKLEKNRSLSWGESSQGKWKGHEEFIKWLAAHCEQGMVAFWSCEGDGAAWAYEFDGSGGFGECSARRVSALKAAATRHRRANSVSGDRIGEHRSATAKAISSSHAGAKRKAQ
ncbi:MAG TPA: hypothetical protein VG269_28595 [Tepidisphaeraceae bacterium]|nr:hypothetical protein [Tepidisphaeraceae bacterium]